MSFTINTNINSLDAQRNASQSQNALATAMQRLSSGLRINSAKDDAAGLAIAERMSSQINGMNVAIRNANDGVSLAQTADGGLSNISNMLQRMRELAVQATNSTNQSGDIDALNQEYSQLASEIGRTLSSVQFNGINVLQATANMDFQVGANSGQTITIQASALGVATATSITTMTTGAASGLTDSANSANAANITAIDAAITTINASRAVLGAVESRFGNTVSFLQTAVENQTAARGQITDANFAEETANLSRAQILQQAGTAMIAQANQLPQQVLSLLR